MQKSLHFQLQVVQHSYFQAAVPVDLRFALAGARVADVQILVGRDLEQVTLEVACMVDADVRIIRKISNVEWTAAS